MGRLIDEDNLIDSIPDLSVFEEEDFCTSDMIHLIEDAPTVEAIPKSEVRKLLRDNAKKVSDSMLDIVKENYIPKSQYETRLKADIEAILVELQLEIEEKFNDRPFSYNHHQRTEFYRDIDEIIQQKINVLEGKINNE